jgi:hypothetical protein
MTEAKQTGPCMPLHCVYQLFSSTVPHTLLYVGRSVNPQRRQRDHERRLGVKTVLRVWRKHFELEKACLSELWLIKETCPVYNRRMVSSKGNIDKSVSDELRALLSKVHTGFKHLEESKLRMSKAQKGRTVSREAREKLRAVHLGKKQTPEHVAKAAATRVGKKHSVEWREKIAAGNRGKPFTQERIENIKLAQQARRARERQQ